MSIFASQEIAVRLALSTTWLSMAKRYFYNDATITVLLFLLDDRKVKTANKINMTYKYKELFTSTKF
jgi:hypothetical protein